MESELLESCHSLTHWRKYLERLFSYFRGGKKHEYEISTYQGTVRLARCLLELVVFAEKHGYFAYSEYG